MMNFMSMMMGMSGMGKGYGSSPYKNNYKTAAQQHAAQQHGARNPGKFRKLRHDIIGEVYS